MSDGVPNSVFGTSIALVDGDFRLVNGDLALVSGTANFGQALQIIVETPFGSDQINVTYGLDVAATFTVAAFYARVTISSPAKRSCCGMPTSFSISIAPKR